MDNVKKFRFHFYYFLIWLLFFQVARLFFVLNQNNPTLSLSINEFVKASVLGTKLDASITGYFCILPFLLFFIGCLLPKNNFASIIFKFTHYLVFTISILLIIIDAGLFEHWNYRIDTSPLKYLKNPNEVLASAQSSPIFKLLISSIIFILFFFFVFSKFLSIWLQNKFTFRLKSEIYIVGFCSTFLISLLFIPIRGGFQLAPINQSAVFFSSNPYPNQVAINAPWNFFDALINQNENKNPFVFMSDKEAKTLIVRRKEAKNYKVIDTTIIKPNVLIIVWESLTSKIVKNLGGLAGVVPNLDTLTGQGIFFRNVYATGDRSDKGLVGILSGYPAQPFGSIMNSASKASKLPVLAKDFAKRGYSTTFMYGGEPEFANIKSYMLSGGFQRIISKNDYPQALQNSKWGVHDGQTFERLLAEIKTEKRQFFYTFFTLSSHEPFDVPMKTKFEGKEEIELFKNAHYYTDQCLGNFLKEAKKQTWWKNTLIIIVADHGHILPYSNKKEMNYRIPMVWTGGLVQKPMIVDEICNQTDIPATILGQLSIDSSQKYEWSEDIFDRNREAKAQFTFNNGFGFKNFKTEYVFDNTYKKVIFKKGNLEGNLLNKGLARQQLSYQDYLDK